MGHEEDIGAKTEALGALGKYPLQQKLGEGGMGIVWLGLHPDLGIRVAIKAIKADKDDPEYVDRFLQEARSAALVNHPRVARIFDAGVDGETHYIVMEYLSGGSIGDLLKEGPLEPEFAVYVAEAVAEGLAAAAESGIIHRDVKPDNIMLDAKGEPKLVDLGLAKEVGGDSNLTTAGILMGTPAYIAPEQATSAATVDGRADVYSLGATLYHMIVGSPPYEAPTPMATALRHCMDPVPSPLVSNPDLPKGLCRIIEKMMAKAPEDRYQTADEVVKALRRKPGKGGGDGAGGKKKRQFRKGGGRKAPTPAKPAVREAASPDAPESSSGLGRGAAIVVVLLGIVVGLVVLLLQSDEDGDSLLLLRQGMDLVMVYDFSDGQGTTVADRSGVGTPLDLTIKDPGAIRWEAGALAITKNTIVRGAKPPDKLLNRVKTTNAISCEAWLTPANTAQFGPARIVTFSKDTVERNFTLGQDRDAYDVRFRTTETGLKALPSITSARKSCAATLTHVVFTRDSTGLERIFVNGVIVGEKKIGGTMKNWTGGQLFALANEKTEDRPWIGTFHLVALYGRELTKEEVTILFRAGKDSASTARRGKGRHRRMSGR